MNLLAAVSPCPDQPPASVSAPGLLGGLLPGGVVVAEIETASESLNLLRRQAQPDDLPANARSDYLVGRLCARRALAVFGIADAVIGRQHDRLPRWPSALTGCITHTRGYCAAAVGLRHAIQAIGIDAERIDDMGPELWSTVLRPAELRWLMAFTVPERQTAAALIFSAKEAFYKCQFPLTRQWLEFGDVEMRLRRGGLVRGSFQIIPKAPLRLRSLVATLPEIAFATGSGLVLTAMTIARPQVRIP